jgi:hypothetical protein
MMLNLGPAWYSHKMIHGMVKQLKMINVNLPVHLLYMA